jgi:hypothetical protein
LIAAKGPPPDWALQTGIQSFSQDARTSRDRGASALQTKAETLTMKTKRAAIRVTNTMLGGSDGFVLKARYEMPDTRFVAPLYRSPICVATGGPQRGTVAKFRY